MKFSATIWISSNFQIQKRIVSTETIWGNILLHQITCNKGGLISESFSLNRLHPPKNNVSNRYPVLLVAFGKKFRIEIWHIFWRIEKLSEIKPPLPTTYRQSFWSHVASSSHTLVSGIILVLRLLIQQFSNSKISQFYVIGQFWSWMQHYVFRFEISVKDVLGMQIFEGWR